APEQHSLTTRVEGEKPTECEPRAWSRNGGHAVQQPGGRKQKQIARAGFDGDRAEAFLDARQVPRKPVRHLWRVRRVRRAVVDTQFAAAVRTLQREDPADQRAAVEARRDVLEHLERRVQVVVQADALAVAEPSNREW